MARFVRNTAILAKIEATYGTDSAPTGAANALLVSNVTANPLNATNVDRDIIRGYLGASEQLVGTAFVELSFDVEIQSSGTAGTAPAFGPLLRAAAFAETITLTAGQERVEYNPITDSMESVSIYYYDSGALHKLLGARGSFDIAMGVGERPVFRFRFVGKDGGISAAANPALTLTAFKKPAVITDTNTGDVTFGAAYTTGTLSGGTAYTSRGMELSSGNDVQFIPMLGSENVEITNRAFTGKLALDLTAAQEVTFMGTVKANTTQSMGFQHGTTGGSVSIVYAPAVQIINPAKEDLNGYRLIGYDMRLVPSAGNDEIKLCFR